MRPVLEADLDALYDLETDVILKQFVGGAVSETRDVWTNRARRVLGYNSRFPLVHKTTRSFAGRLTLGHYQSPESREIQLLLAKTFVGKGHGSEVCRLGCAYPFEVLEATRVVGVVDPSHIASLRLVEQLGFVEIEPQTNNHDVLVKRVFALYKVPN